MTRPELSLIVPFYNEPKIYDNALVFLDFLKTNFESYELILVSDGSGEEYLTQLKKINGKSKHFRLLSYEKNQGRGYAITTGLKKAVGDFVVYIDCDLDIDPVYIKDVYRLLNDFDVVVASKFHKASNVKSPLYRKIPSILFNTAVRIVLSSKIKDHQIGLKGFRKEVINKVLPHVSEKRWLFDVEILYLIQKHKFRIAEIPISFKYGYGKIRTSFVIDSIKLFIFIFVIRLRHSKIF